MSEAKTFADVQTATSLTANEQFLLTDSQGNVKRIAANTALNGFNLKGASIPSTVTSGWVRIARLATEGFALLYCYAGWGSAGPQSMLLDVSGHISGGAVHNRVHNLSKNSGGFTKARIVKSGNSLYVDLYFTLRPGNIYTKFLAGRIAELTDVEFNPQLADTDVAYETVWGG